MKERCPRCAFPLQRGEAHDYWLGGMMFNIGLSELLAVLAVAAVVLGSWPRVPWTAVWIGAIALMLAAPFLLFPLSRTMWLAFDLLFRPRHESHYR
jgi:formate-dependent nitrite reductase membrane component NrfD